ncbi:MAG: hypothetical protein ABSB94_18700 [Syntrophorhabdales bacterium]|jgi:hypothetical protein
MSSISSISSSTNAYQNQFQQIRKDFLTLQTDLSSGSLATAQQAYAALTQDLQAAQQTEGGQQTGGTSQISTDLAAVGSALQSGSISDAQNAFATLTQDLQNALQTEAAQGTQQAYGHHHHHHHGSGSQTASTGVSTDLAAVGSALQSGNITSAQSAFATLMQDLGNSSAQSTTGTSGSSTLVQAVGTNVNIAV